MIVVSDSTPLIELSKIGRLDLLKQVYGRVTIPQEVYDEVVTHGGGQPGAQEVQAATWIDVLRVTNSQAVQQLQSAHPQLGLGECAAMVLADECQAQRIIIDDGLARQVAQQRGLPFVGTVGILLLAKQQEIVPTIKDLLDDLRAHGARISPTLYQHALGLAGK